MAEIYNKQYTRWQQNDCNSITLTAIALPGEIVSNLGALATTTENALGVCPEGGDIGDTVLVVCRDNAIISAKVVATNNVVIGSPLTVSATPGSLKLAVSGEMVLGYALEACNVTAGNTAIIPIRLMLQYKI